MKRLVSVLFFLVLTLATVALLAPGFIDWNQHKAGIASVLESHIQRKVNIGGNVAFRILPQPQIVLEDVSISNPEGAKADFFLQLKRLEARVKFRPLLEGRIEVEDIALIEPQLNLEILSDGKASWSGILKDSKTNGRTGIEPEAIRLNKVAVQDGSIHYINHITGAEGQVGSLDLAITGDTLTGPYRIGGKMLYADTVMNLEMTTGAYDGVAKFPLTIALLPMTGLPQMRLNGVVDFSAGFDVQGDIDIGQGALSGLFGNHSFGAIPLLKQNAAVTATLNFKGNEAKMSDIKAKFGKDGLLSGNVSVLFSHGRKPVVSADLEGHDLVVSDKSYAFPGPPASFDVGLKFKGKNITWEGAVLPSVTLAVDSDQKSWIIKQMRFFLPGQSDVRVAGVVTPSARYAGLSVQMETEDLGKMLQAIPLDVHDALKGLAGDSLVKKLKLSSNADFKPDNISFTDIDAVIADGVKATGSLDIARGAQKAGFAAKMAFDGWDSKLFPAGATGAFLNNMTQAEGDLDLHFTNSQQGKLKIRDMKISAKSDETGMLFKNVVATMANGDGFDFSGRVSRFAPLRGLDLSYVVKAGNVAAFTEAFGLPLSPLGDWKKVSLRGKVRGDAVKYDFTAAGDANGGAADVQGSYEDGTGYKGAMHLKGPAAGGVPGILAWKLLAPQDGVFDFSGDFSGTADAYKIGNIHAQSGGEALSGNVLRKDGKYAADLTVDKIDFDSWLWSDWAVKGGMDLLLHGKTLEWRGMTIANPAVQMQLDASAITLSKLTGNLWGGNVEATVQARSTNGVWSGALKGSVENADLDLFRQALEIKGVTLGKGGIVFDLKSDGSKFGFKAMSGTLLLKTDTLAIDSFNPEQTAVMLMQLTAGPANLQQLVNHALKESGKTIYTHVELPIKMSDGLASFENVNLSGDNHDAIVRATYDMVPDTYDLSADIHLKKMDGTPVIGIHRADNIKKSGDYGVDVRAIEAWLTKKFVQQATTPASQDKSEVQGIIQRLEDKGD
jgi:hypothetical protein